MTGCGTCWPPSANRSSRSVMRPNTLSKSMMRAPDRDSQNVTRCDHDTGSGAAARRTSAMPQRRRCSIVRTLVVLARGRAVRHLATWFETTQGTPCRRQLRGGREPAGPPPTTRTATVSSGSQASTLTRPIAVRHLVRGISVPMSGTRCEGDAPRRSARRIAREIDRHTAMTAGRSAIGSTSADGVTTDSAAITSSLRPRIGAATDVMGDGSGLDATATPSRRTPARVVRSSVGVRDRFSGAGTGRRRAT